MEMNKITSPTCIAILPISLIVVSSGCTVALGALGRAGDKQKSSTNFTVGKHELARINRGSSVEVYATDGRILRGTILGAQTDNSIDTIKLRKRDNSQISLKTSGIEKVQVPAQKKNAQFIGTAVGSYI